MVTINQILREQSLEKLTKGYYEHYPYLTNIEDNE